MNRVGRYEVIEKLGQGGMGTVYKAFDPLLTRVVAVKVISGQLDSNPEHRERFFREARAAAQLSHRNIITIYDLGEQDGAPFLAMEYLEGRDLDQRLRDQQGITLTRKLELAMSISEGLAHAHACGLIHRDIKPANVFVTDDGDVKVLDFGLARLITSELTRSNIMVGTVNYMAPEQLRGERADHRADIFSFGVLLYEMLGGRKPFQGDSAASTMYKILHDEPEALDEIDPTLGPPLTSIVDRAMAKAREDRYQRMTDLLRDLETAYEPLRGADRRVISRVEAALRPLSGSAVTEALPEYDHNAATISDNTLPDSGPRRDPSPRPATPPPSARPATPQPVARTVTPPPEPAPTPSSRWHGALIAAVLIFGLVAAVWLFTSRRHPPAQVVQTPPAAAPAPPSPVPPPSASPPATVQDPAVAELPKPEPESPASRESARTTREPDGPAERSRATAALNAVDVAKAAANSANARELAPEVFAAAEREEARGREDLRQRRFTSATGRLEATATLYKSATTAAAAESDARAARRSAEDARRRAEQAERQVPAPAPPVPAGPPPVAPPPPVARPEPAPAPSPAPALPAPGPAASELIAATLRRYTAALEQRDINALKGVWPGLGRAQQEAVEAEFANARAISVELASPKIDVAGTTATVTTVRHYSLRTKDGQQLRSDTTTVLTLRQSGGAWVIDSVSHRPIR